MTKRISMMRPGLLFFILASASLQSQPNIRVWNLASLQKNILENSSDTTFVVNFWATWCKPCVEELPAFIQLDSMVKAEKAKVCVVMISLDFRKNLNSSLRPFVGKRKMRTQVILFSDPDMNTWIDVVSKEWSGGIPATLVINNRRNIRIFREQQLSLQELQTLLHINGE